MQLINTIEKIPDAARGCVVAIGNFDGLHLGHQSVIANAGRIAREKGLGLAVLTFDPHPRRFFRPDDAPFFLTPFAVKSRLMAILNVDYVFVQTFSKPFSLKPASAFIQDLLVDKLQARHIVVGEQFHFGYDRLGDSKLMRNKSIELGFDFTEVRPIRNMHGVIYSSTIVRDALKEGDITTATQVLGRPWEVSGTVIRGLQQARTFGAPTANMTLDDYYRPRYGVYAVRVAVGEDTHITWHNGVANFGKRPTLDGTTELFEPHIFDFNDDLYGKVLRVQLVDFIREEQYFNNLRGLTEQIGKDVIAARAILQEKYPHN